MTRGVVFVWLCASMPAFAAMFTLARQFDGDLGVPWQRMGLESLAYLAILLIVSRPKAVQAILLKLDGPRRSFLAVVLAMVLFAQLLSLSQLTYPFVAWGMYTVRVDALPIIELEAKHESGRLSRYPFHAVHPARSPRALMARFGGSIAEAADEDTEASRRAELLAELRYVANVLIDTYNESTAMTRSDRCACTAPS